MTLKTQEHYALMEQFEKEFRTLRLDKEPKQLWSKGVIYQNGNTNEIFLAYRQGYAFGRAVERD